MIETVTIAKKEYDNLLARVEWLDCLESAGVDNWEGIEEAHNIKRDMEESNG